LPTTPEIFLVEAEDENARRVTRGDSGYTGLAWSPDGSLLAAVGGRRFEVEVLAMDGRRMARLGGGGPPAWSPDGRQLAFVERREGASQQAGVVVAGSAGGGRRSVASDGAAAVRQAPSWSPDGRRIAFVSSHGRRSPAHPVGNLDVSVVQARGGAERRLTRSPADEDEPRWSPDGHEIIFRSRDDFNAAVSLWAVSADGTARRRVLGGDIEYLLAEWSPDGQRIAVVAVHTNHRDRRLIVVTPDGGELGRSDVSGVARPAWSPGGDEIVVPRFDGGIDVFDAGAEKVRTLRGLPGSSIIEIVRAPADRIAIAARRLPPPD
jgi:Tol biopolymer transport system component